MKKRIMSFIFAAAATLSLNAQTAPIEWTQNGIPIRQGLNIEWQRTAVTTSDGVVYVWSDTKDGGRDIFAKKVGLDGSLVWGEEPKLITDRPQRQEDPVAIETADGNIIVAWVDYNEDLDGDVFAQKIDENGDIVWDEPVQICQLDAEQKTLNIVPDNTDGVFILWVDKRGIGKDIYGQHLNGDGTVSWDENGLGLATGDGEQYSHSFWEDDAGNAALVYVNKTGENEDIYAIKVNENGIVWGGTENPVALINTPFVESNAKICPDGTGGFYFSWIDKSIDNQGNIRAQRLNADGTLAWDDDAIISNLPGIQRNPRVTKSSDNSFFVAWESILEGEASTDNIFVQKVNADGTIEWAENGLELVDQPNEQRNPRLTTDGNGGVVVTWDDRRGNGSATIDIYAQHVDSTGNLTWQTDGIVISDPIEEQKSPSIRMVDGKFFIAWGDRRTGSEGIYYQIVTQEGNTLLEEDGAQLHWGLSGDVKHFDAKQYNDETFFIWNDTRYGSLGWRILIQSVDAEGNLGFAENGLEITGSVTPGSNQSNQDVAITPDGIVVIWEQLEDSYYRVFAQLIGFDGTRLWGENGIELSTFLGEQKFAQVSYKDGAYYFLWNDLRTADLLNIYGQKIVNGEKQWGDDAKALTVGENDYTLVDVFDTYYVFTRSNLYFVKRFDEDGNLPAGWNSNGVLCTNSVLPVNLVGEIVDEDLMVMWEDTRHTSEENGGKSIYGQLIHPDGSIEYEQYGAAIANANGEQIEPAFLPQEDGMFVAWADQRTGIYRNIMMDYNLFTDGLPTWAEPLYVGQATYAQNNPTLIETDGNVFVVWENTIESDVNLKIQRYNTETQDTDWNAQGYDLANEFFKQVDVVMNEISNNKIVAAWRDYRSSGKTDIIGLYAQKIDASTNDAEDIVQTPKGSLLQNYPNPFSLSNNQRGNGTTIHFESPKVQNAKVTIYNVKGQKVVELFNGSLEKGNNTFTWNGKNKDEKDVATGIYFYKIRTENHAAAKKMLIMK